MFYTDMHCHLLCGVDDGAKTPEIMYQMLDAAYQSGTRHICATPHFHPELFGDKSEKSQKHFAALTTYAKEKYPDMRLSLGNEMGYHSAWRMALKNGGCSFLGGRYLLVDFPADLSFFDLCYAMDDMLSVGIPLILAHVERYEALYWEYDQINDWCRRGLLLQMNASSFSPKRSFKRKMHIKRLIRRCPISLVASDGHNMTSRLPILSVAEERIIPKYGVERAKYWLSDAPSLILDGKVL